MISYVELKDVCEISMGQAPVGTSYNESGEGYPLLAGAGDLGDTTPNPKKFTRQPARISQRDDLILCIRATIGDLNWSDKEYCLGRGVAGLRPRHDKLDRKYLWHFINVNRRDLEARGTGSTFKQVGRAHIEEWKIPLPPLPEQKRIAAILDKADAIRRKRQQAIQLADQLLRAVFLEMFGDPVTNPKGWEVKCVGELADCIVPGRDKPKSFTGEIPWVTTNDLRHLGKTKCSEKFIGLTDAEVLQVRAKIIPRNSVLMTCVGDLGVLSIADNPMIINQQLHAFLPSENFESVFLMFALSYQKHYMLKMASNTTLPYMNKTICNSVPVIAPPKKVQKEFSQMYEKHSKNCIKSTQNISQMNDLFSSLSQKAFAGEL